MKTLHEIGFLMDYGTPTFNIIKIDFHFCGFCAYVSFIIFGIGIGWRCRIEQ